MPRKATAFLLGLTLLTCFAVPGFADGGFGDVLYHWAVPFVEEMHTLGIVSGYEDGNFRPDGTVTRAELAVLLSRLVKIPAAYEPASKFYDVGGKDWFGRGVVFLADRGVLNDAPEGFGMKPMFRPHDNIIREDMAVILDRFGKEYLLEWGSADGTDAAVYGDGRTVAPGALESVQKVIDHELMTGYGSVSGGDFMWKPKKEVTRAEAAKVIAALYHKLNAVSNYIIALPDEIKEIVTTITHAEAWKGAGEAIISVYHKGTRAKYPEMGFVFDLVRHKHNELDKINEIAQMVGGIMIFAYDDHYYYCWETPTDVQLDVNDEAAVSEYNAVADKIREIADAFIRDNGLERFEKSIE